MLIEIIATTTVILGHPEWVFKPTKQVSCMYEMQDPLLTEILYGE